MPPAEGIRELAREHGTRIIISPLDSYVSCRMVTLAIAVCGGWRTDRR